MRYFKDMRNQIDELAFSFDHHHYTDYYKAQSELYCKTDAYHELQARRLIRLAGKKRIELLYNLAVERRFQHAEDLRQARICIHTLESNLKTSTFNVNSSQTKQTVRKLKTYKHLLKKGFNSFYAYQVTSLEKALELVATQSA